MEERSWYQAFIPQPDDEALADYSIVIDGCIAFGRLLHDGDFSDENIRKIIASDPTIRVMSYRRRNRVGIKPRWLRKLAKGGDVQRQLHDLIVTR